LDEDPVLRVIKPVEPIVPAFEVDKIIFPLDELLLDPLTIDIAPPVVPVEDAPPLNILTSPPTPLDA